MDWGCTEMLAYASLLEDGFAVRLTGQDSGRGTFFHRHAVLHNQRNGEPYVPLQNLQPGQPWFTIVDSILSEEAVLGFEFGYSTTEPKTLVIWEAQFGDFVNGAQVVIDQFISSSEQKWRWLCGLVLMLPHGWEGQGPEHSSARLERFIQLCAQENMQVCIPSTPSQMFHLLRRQMRRFYRKPLIIMSPKSLLRRKVTFSSVEDLTERGYRLIIGETAQLDKTKVDRLVICSGKVYWDILEVREEKGKNNVAIIRLEQVYPFPKKTMKRELGKYPQVTDIVWAQEEPRNQGVWRSVQHDIRACMQEGQTLTYVGRRPTAAPASGNPRSHQQQQKKLIREALTLKAPANSEILPHETQAHKILKK